MSIQVFNKKDLYEKSKVAIIIVTLFVVLRIINLDWLCFFRFGIGIPCPGCGFTRATIALLQFDIQKSIYYHPLVIPSIIFVVVYCYNNYLISSPKISNKKLINIMLILFIAVYILRWFNLIPFSYQLEFEDNNFISKVIEYITN